MACGKGTLVTGIIVCGRASHPDARSLFFCLFIAIFGLVCFSSAHAQSLSLKNASLTVELDSGSGVVTRWQPHILDQATAPIQDFAGPEASLFRLKGDLSGVPLSDLQSTSGWQVLQHNAGRVELMLQEPRSGLALHQAWVLDQERPWQAEYSTWIQAEPGAALDAFANLWLELGPGIGEAPAQGLGIAQNLYSYTQGILELDGEVVRVPLSEPGQVIEGTDPPSLLGLQSRYFAFVLSPVGFDPPEWQFAAPENPQHYPGNAAFESELRVSLPVLSPGSGPVNFRVFGGAKSYPVLQQSEPALDNLLFPDLWNWMRALTIGLMHVLNIIFGVIGNWGVAILLLAVFVRLLIHPVAKRAMAAQKRFVALQEKIQPELKEIKRNYKGGEQSELILQLYERHKTSPFAGLKPLLIVLLQIPIFVALYHLLGQHFELREQSFLWMNSLAEPDQLFSFGVDLPFFGSYFNFLPALMALTTLASIKLSPAPAPDKNSSAMNSIMMLLLTLIFFLLFYSFPSGMVLYWAAANVLQLIHQGLSVLSFSGKDIQDV